MNIRIPCVRIPRIQHYSLRIARPIRLVATLWGQKRALVFRVAYREGERTVVERGRHR